MDTSLSYTDRDSAYFSSDENRWIQKIRKLKQQRPDEIAVELDPENNDGCICAKFPVSWFKIAPPVKRKLTDEQRQAYSERMKALHRKQVKYSGKTDR